MCVCFCVCVCVNMCVLIRVENGSFSGVSMMMIIASAFNLIRFFRCRFSLLFSPVHRFGCIAFDFWNSPMRHVFYNHCNPHYIYYTTIAYCALCFDAFLLTVHLIVETIVSIHQLSQQQTNIYAAIYYLFRKYLQTLYLLDVSAKQLVVFLYLLRFS